MDYGLGCLECNKIYKNVAFRFCPICGAALSSGAARLIYNRKASERQAAYRERKRSQSNDTERKRSRRRTHEEYQDYLIDCYVRDTIEFVESMEEVNGILFGMDD